MRLISIVSSDNPPLCRIISRANGVHRLEQCVCSIAQRFPGLRREGGRRHEEALSGLEAVEATEESHEWRRNLLYCPPSIASLGRKFGQAREDLDYYSVCTAVTSSADKCAVEVGNRTSVAHGDQEGVRPHFRRRLVFRPLPEPATRPTTQFRAAPAPAVWFRRASERNIVRFVDAGAWRVSSLFPFAAGCEFREAHEELNIDPVWTGTLKPPIRG